MVPEIVRQAVQIKMRCRTESPLISEAEYCCACGIGLKLLGDPQGLLEQVKQMDTVGQVKEAVVPLFREAIEQTEDPERKRLFHLLVNSRVEGGISEEIRPLFDPA
ncbi:MAG: DUF3837 family protein [Candidatus Limivivens sp.]|nr:DUF3837 family protein [Candidatus Limivivens sp.]